MKTTTKNKAKSCNAKQKSILFIITCLFVFNYIMQAQNFKIGATLNQINTGSGLGLSFSPQITLAKNNNLIYAGINIQKRNCNFSGFRMGYQYVIELENQNELFFFFDAACHHQALLGKNTLKMESRVNPENAGFYTTVKMKAIAQHVGFGMNLSLNESVKLFGAIGAGMYNTLEVSRKEAFRYRDCSAASIMLSAGLKFNITK